MSFAEFLRYGAGPGVAAVVGVLLAFAGENVGFYQALGRRAKALVFIAFCFAMPLLCAVLLGVCGYEPWSFDPLFWRAIVAGFVASGIGSLAHVPDMEPH